MTAVRALWTELKQFSLESLLDSRTRFRRRTIFAASLLFVSVVFADVIFQRASLSMLDNQNVTGMPRTYTSLYPEESWRLPYMGYYDAGGAGFQSEPAQFFMKNVIQGLESPFWDPYSSAGSFGPELLVDIKFSPFTILSAVGGATSKAFHISALFLYALAIFFVYRLCTEPLGLSPMAAMAGCVVYLLSGYFVANLNSNVSQIYFYFPMALFYLLALNLQRTPWNFILVVLSITCIFLCTFMPTTSLALTVLFLVASVHAVSLGGTWPERLRRFTLAAAPFFIATLLVAFVYLPIVEVLAYTKGLESYGTRVFYPSNWKALLSFFTPKHFAESYNASSPQFYEFQKNVIFHFGILPGLMAVQAFACRRYLKNPVFLAIAAIFLVGLGRIFAAPVLSHIIDVLPFFRSVGCQYWWIVVGPLVPLLVAFGVEATIKDRVSVWAATALAFVILVLGLFVFLNVGFNDNPLYLTRGLAHRYLRFGLVLLGLGTFFFWIWSGRVKPKFFSAMHHPRLLLGFVVLIFVELTFYMNHTRFVRMDLTQAPDYVQFIKKDLGLNRIANYGLHGIPAHLGAAFQIPQLESFAMHLIPEYAALCERAISNQQVNVGYPFCTTRAEKDGVNVNQAVLDMMSVKYFVVSKHLPKYVEYFDSAKFNVGFESPSFKIFENPAPGPRLYSVSTLIKGDLTPEAHGLKAVEAAVTEDDALIQLARTAGISNHPPPPGQAGSQGVNEGKITAYHHATVRAEIEMSTPGVLLLMDNWHPSWKAVVNGAPAYIGKVNQSFRGIVLSAGKHNVEMTYRPKTLNLGLALGALGLLILVSSFYWMRFADAYVGTSRRTK